MYLKWSGFVLDWCAKCLTNISWQSDLNLKLMSTCVTYGGWEGTVALHTRRTNPNTQYISKLGKHLCEFDVYKI